MEKTISKERPLKKKPGSGAKITSRKTSIIVISVLTGCIFGSIVFFCINHIVRKNFLSEIEKKYEQDVSSLKRSIADKDHEIAVLQSKSLKTASTLKIEIGKLNVRIDEKVKEIEELKSQPLPASQNRIIELEKDLAELRIENEILKTKHNDMVSNQRRIEQEYKDQNFFKEENSEYDSKNAQGDSNETPYFVNGSVEGEVSLLILEDHLRQNNKNLILDDITTEKNSNESNIEENNSISSIRFINPNKKNGNFENEPVDIKTRMNEEMSKENGLGGMLHLIKGLKQTNEQLRKDLTKAQKAMHTKRNTP